MSTVHAGQRLTLPALIAAFAAASLLAVPVRAADPPADRSVIRFESGAGASAHRGATQGTEACALEVAASDEVWGVEAAVVPDELFYLYGEGWAPGTEADLTTTDLATGDEEYYTVPVDASGVLAAAASFNRGFYGTFRFTVTQAEPTCEAVAHFEVLPMADVLDSKFLFDIKWLYSKDITTGCGSDLFCPDGSVTRAQMATFLTRALGLPPSTTDYFTDDAGNKHEANINRLRAAGITYGCSPTMFCPDGRVTRAQMASFLARAFTLPTTTTDYFTDDAGNKHEANINRLRAAGVTYGCSATRFCPDGTVTRGQMAAFIHRAKE